MDLGPTEPYTTGFGAVPKPEEPERPEWAPPPIPPPAQYVSPWTASAQPYPWAAGGNAAATVVNNIKVGAHGYRRCNHLLHATLTFFTCGLWAPVWGIAWAASRRAA